ncbi:uncharacterized protein LOC119012499 isoform X1 [Acanthopagrus latus]|uniref:uncharacterized protein LOC119012499 isoform X1 n=1 Tax=Acanthopagrus latus TaxID=8177 RepID=UPI00187C5191|nr:uncharacterized protein LOC119012499 isoform X1 [Acanthopagrus latus]
MIIRRETEEGERQRIMMVQFKWIQMSLFVTAMLQFTGAAENLPASFTVTVGDDVTLTCENVIKPQQQCNSTTWTFSGLGSKRTVELVELGQIGKDVKAKDRLSVTEKCSLVIKTVTVEDVGHYICQQYEYRGAPKSSPDSVVYLSVVSMTEHQNHDEVTLICSVWTYGPCKHTVKWLYEGKEVDTDNGGVTTSQSLCSASVTFQRTQSLYECKVTDGNKKQLFPFRLQSSGKKPATTESSDTSRTERTNTGSGTDGSTSELQRIGWRCIIVSVGLSALLISVVTVSMWTRTKGNKTQRQENRQHDDEDEDEGTVVYENTGEPSASVRLH